MIEVYLSGFIICFVFGVSYVAWVLTNDPYAEFSFDMIFNVVLLSLLSWVMVYMVLVGLVFEFIRDRK